MKYRLGIKLDTNAIGTAVIRLEDHPKIGGGSEPSVQDAVRNALGVIDNDAQQLPPWMDVAREMVIVRYANESDLQGVTLDEYRERLAQATAEAKVNGFALRFVDFNRQQYQQWLGDREDTGEMRANWAQRVCEKNDEQI